MSDEQGRELQGGGAADSVVRETAATPPALVSDDETTTRAVAPRPKPGRRALALVLTLLCACAVAGLMYVGYSGRLRARVTEQAEKVRDVITGARPPDPYTAAVLKVEEVRGEGEAIGRKADVDVPAELKQYAESRRFLAIQEASARDAGLTPPHDFAELVSQIKEGGLTEAPKLGRGYVVYGVGLAATGALTHYDAARGRSVPLFADDAALKSYADGLDAERKRLTDEQKETNEKLKALDKKDKQARSQLNAEAAAERKGLAGVEEGVKSLKLYYGAPKDRAALFGEYETLSTFARDFGGRSYDLNDTAAAKEFQARLLTYARPAALAVLEELGSAYQEKFGRPLPVTSLIRTEEYQRTLREAGNANAGSFAVEPHTTGLAFDIYYHFMNAEEQQFVMDEIARLERDGRVEALRELRDHYHVFAFPRGVRPEEKSVDKILKGGAREKADDSKAKAEETKGKKDSKTKKEEPKTKKPGARKSKDSSARAPSRVKKGARRR